MLTKNELLSYRLIANSTKVIYLSFMLLLHCHKGFFKTLCPSTSCILSHVNSFHIFASHNLYIYCRYQFLSKRGKLRSYNLLGSVTQTSKAMEYDRFYPSEIFLENKNFPWELKTSNTETLLISCQHYLSLINFIIFI